MTDVPDYIPPASTPTQAVHQELASTFQWQSLSQDQLNSLRSRLIESIIQVVVQAVTGIFVPGGGVGGATDQLQAWAAAIPGLSTILDMIESVTGFDLTTLFSGFGTSSSILNQLIGLVPGTAGGLTGLGGLGSIFDDLFGIVGSPTAVGSGTPALPGATSIPLLGGLFSGSSFLGSLIPGLDASKIITGNFSISQITNLATLLGGFGTSSSILNQLIGLIPGATGGLTGLTGFGSVFTDLFGMLGSPTAVGSGTPVLPAVTSRPILGGLFSGSSFLGSLIPTLDASKIISGTFPFSMTGAQSIIDALSNPLAGTTGNTFSLSDLGSLFTAIPSSFVLGYGGPGTVADTLQATWDQLISGGTGVIGTGGSLANLFDVFNINSSNSARGAMAFDIAAIRNNRATWRGMLPSSDATLSLNSLMFNKVSGTPTAPTVNIPFNTSLIAWDLIGQAGDKQVIEWHGNTVSGLTDFRLRVWTMDTATGNTHCVYTSANVLGSISAAQGVNQHTMPSPITFEAGNIFGIEWHPIGTSGGHNVVGDTTWVTYNHPTIFPRRKASTRASGSSTTTPADVASPTYSNAIPLVEFALSTGNPAAPHSDETRQFSTVGSNTTVVPDWANFVDYIMVPAAGGGNGGTSTLGINGIHGNCGTWIDGTWARGTDFTGTTIISYTIADGGAAGAFFGAGGSASNSTVSIPGHTGTATGGTGGSGLGSATGPSPGNHTYRSVPYVGGGTQNTTGAAGTVPGGGGAGGGYGQGGGKGGRASLWVVFRQS